MIYWRMYRIGLSVALILVLSGCDAFKVPIAPSLPVSDADFTNALARPATGGPLGLTPKLSGKVDGWSISSTRPVWLSGLQKIFVGSIDGAGNYNVTLPAQLPAAQQMTLQQFVRRFNFLEDQDCSVNTLVISMPDAVVGKVNFLSVDREVTAASVGLQPQFSPPPPYVSFNLFTEYFNTIQVALYSSVAATAKGELSCASSYSSGSRYHLFVNIALSPGWNTVTGLYDKERKIGSENVQKVLLKGGLGRNGLD